MYSQFDSLEPTDKEFADKIGEFIPFTLPRLRLSITMCMIHALVQCLAGLWRKAVVGKETVSIPNSDDEGSQSASTTFKPKYDLMQKQLHLVIYLNLQEFSKILPLVPSP